MKMFLKHFYKVYLNHSFRYYSFKRNNLFQKKQSARNIIGETIETYKINCSKDWKLIRQELIESESNRGQYTDNNIDAVILGYCISENKFNLGLHYIHFLKNENIKPNIAYIGKYLKYLYKTNEKDVFNNGKKCVKSQEEEIIKTYNDLRNKYPILDSLTLDNVIPALSLTREWKKCLDLLQELKISTIPGGHACSSIVAAAFLNKDEDLAWQLLKEIIENNQRIGSNAFLAYINSLRRLKKPEIAMIKLEHIFLFLQENDLLVESVVTEKLLEFGKKLGFSGNFSPITKNGVCDCCNQQLENFEISNEDFEELKTKIFEKVIVGKDVFIKTNPQELERFNKFILNRGRFDVVLDGLNIAYSAGTRQAPHVFAALLEAVVAHFVKQNKEVLIVGRNHMTKWPRKSWDFIKENATVFLAQNISQDDPYLLYCALNSGKDTIIVTRDLMRGHKFLLKTPKHRMLFNRWLSQRQHQLVRVTASGTPIFSYPPPYTISTQKNGNYWHIPFKNEVSGKDSIVGWFCLSSQSK